MQSLLDYRRCIYDIQENRRLAHPFQRVAVKIYLAPIVTISWGTTHGYTMAHHQAHSSNIGFSVGYPII